MVKIGGKYTLKTPKKHRIKVKNDLKCNKIRVK